jgi:hypothetical protein
MWVRGTCLTSRSLLMFAFLLARCDVVVPLSCAAQVTLQAFFHDTSSICCDGCWDGVLDAVEHGKAICDICVKAADNCGVEVGWVWGTDVDSDCCVNADNVCITGAASRSGVKAEGEDNDKAEVGEDVKADSCDKAEGECAFLVLGYGPGVKLAGTGVGTGSKETGVWCQSLVLLVAITVMALTASS